MTITYEPIAPASMVAFAAAFAPLGGGAGYLVGRAVTYAISPLNPVLGATFGAVAIVVGGGIVASTSALVQKKIINSNQQELVIGIASIILYPMTSFITCRCLHLAFTWKAFSLFTLGGLALVTAAALIGLVAHKILQSNKPKQMIPNNNISV